MKVLPYIFLLTQLFLATEFLAQYVPMKVFQNLVGSTWSSKGKQLGEHEGKTVHELKFTLLYKIIKTKT